MAIAYRIVQSRFVSSALDGEGARLYGGRWNEKGHRMVYTSATASLAVLETFVHLGLNAKSTAHVILEIEIPDELIEQASGLPSEWKESPVLEAYQDFGSKWLLSGRSAALKIPSAIIEQEYNYLLNPEHPDFSRISVLNTLEYGFDERMWKP